MRTSCNGCRVLRKGCSDDCIIRPCLHWISSPDAQANATVFLAKFYGRTGLLNLLSAGPDHLRPAMFQSLLYEACGRVVDPVYGSLGLLYSGRWHDCQVAVGSVLKGSPIMQLSPIPPEGFSYESPPSQQMNLSLLRLYDVRHIQSSRELGQPSSVEIGMNDRTRPRLRRTHRVRASNSDQFSINNGGGDNDYYHENDNGMFSAETTTEGSVDGENEVDLDLTLGFN